MEIPLITKIGEIPTSKINLETRKGTQIENVQCHGISSFYRNQFSDFDKKWSHLSKRANYSGIYNCHGLTFASRRTCIENDQMITIILNEDDYKEKDRNEALPGDIIVYYQKNSAIHSGILLSKPGNALEPAQVLSKCGVYGEYVHKEFERVYDFDTIKYFRIDDEDTGIS